MRATAFAIRSTMGSDETPVWWSDAWNSWEEDRSKASRYPYYSAVERLASLRHEGMIALRARIIGLRSKGKP